MKKGDFFIGLIILLVMGLLGLGYKLYLSSLGDARFVEIRIDGKVFKTVELTKDTDEWIIIDNQYGYNKIHIYNMGVQVTEADCENQVDVRKGFVNTPGNSIICVPHHLEIRIVGGNSLDGVSGL